jgi:hypothetical protein
MNMWVGGIGGMTLSFLCKYSIYLFNVSHTQQRYRVFLQETNFCPSYEPSSGLIQEQNFKIAI